MEDRRTCLTVWKARRRRGSSAGSSTYCPYQSHGRSLRHVLTGRNVNQAKSPFVMLRSWARNRNCAWTEVLE